MITNAGAELAVFAESFRSWRRITASLPTEVRFAVFENSYQPGGTERLKALQQGRRAASARNLTGGRSHSNS